MTSETGDWTVIIPMKPFAEAKTRLRGSPLDKLAPDSSQLAEAFLRDVIEASHGADKTSRVFVTSTDPVVGGIATQAGAEFLIEAAPTQQAEHRGGNDLNEALVAALAHVNEEHGGHRIVIVTGDLAALRSDSLDSVLLAVEGLGESGFVADVEGSGTTILALLAGPVVIPQFGTDSARAHREVGVREVSRHAGSDARLDIDTPEDLRAAILLGVGAHTKSALTGSCTEPA